MARRSTLVAVLPRIASVALALAGCTRLEAGRDAGTEPLDAPAAASPSASATASGATPTSPPASAAASTLASGSSGAPSASGGTAAPIAIHAGDAGGPCRTLRGPIELPVRGAAAIVVHADRVDAILDDDGRPRVASYPIAGPTPAERESASGGGPAGAPAGLRVACAPAGDVAFCPDKTGAIHRARITGEGDRIVASGRTGSRIAAAVIGGNHTALAYIAARKTTEGWVSEAWLAVDDEPPLRLSEDGSGATTIDLVPRGSALIALYVDARTALTALHARPVAYDHGARLGDDVVVFVGGPGERHTTAVAALPPSGPGWALLPIARDISDFGLAVVRLEDPLRVDEPVVWSMYPNGLDPAPIAAALGGGREARDGGGGARTWVVRARPQSAEASAPRILELGEVLTDGSFAALDVVPTSGAPSEARLTPGAQGDLWLSWIDGSGSWLERLSCR
jgi:hypothetical protein